MRRSSRAIRSRSRIVRRVRRAAYGLCFAVALLASADVVAEIAAESPADATPATPAPETETTDTARLDARFPRHVTPPLIFPSNTLSPTERAGGWRLLFDGQTGDAWRSREGEGFPEKGWSIRGGELVVEAAGSFTLRAGGDLFSVDRYRDFVLDFEFALSRGANSGVKYRARERSRLGFVDAVGCEYQILDDARHPDAERGREGNRRLASLYDLVPAASPWPRTIGTWNHGRIHVEDGVAAHYLNGDRVLLVDFRGPAWRDALADSKFADAVDYCADAPGHIVLQDHGDAVRFRNLRVRPLDRPENDS